MIGIEPIGDSSEPPNVLEGEEEARRLHGQDPLELLLGRTRRRDLGDLGLEEVAELAD